jgi:zinc transporter 1/2/3
MLFAMLAAGGAAFFGPIFLASFVTPQNIVFSMLRQFGAGVIIQQPLFMSGSPHPCSWSRSAVALIVSPKLLTHANLMFGNEYLGEPTFEGTAASIMMAGLFPSFLVDYAVYRFMQWYTAKASADLGASTAPRSTCSTKLVN